MALCLEDIRTYTKDQPMMNVLLEGRYQSSDELIDMVKELVIQDFNLVAPITSMNAESFESIFPHSSLMLYGVLFHLAVSEAERQLRNQVNYNAQGLNVGIDDKYAQYMQLADFYKRMFDQNVTQCKQFLNQQSAWGGVHSPMAAINNYQFRD